MDPLLWPKSAQGIQQLKRNKFFHIPEWNTIREKKIINIYNIKLGIQFEYNRKHVNRLISFSHHFERAFRSTDIVCYSVHKSQHMLPQFCARCAFLPSSLPLSLSLLFPLRVHVYFEQGNYTSISSVMRTCNKSLNRKSNRLIYEDRIAQCFHTR